jgi:putative DNA-invertase from lambdoid prophage Rac
MQLAEARGLTVVEVYEENISAVKDRPEWLRLKTAAHQGKLDAVLVFALDRLGRSLVGNLQEVLTLERLGVEVISVREPWLDMGGPIRELLIAIFSWVAQEERRQIASRCRAGQERARRQGKHVGRPKAEVDLERAIELRARGLSIRKVAEKLGCGSSATTAKCLKSRTLSRALRRAGGHLGHAGKA